jgi:hypothetical protein
MSPAELGTEIDCAGEGQQKFTLSTDLDEKFMKKR